MKTSVEITVPFYDLDPMNVVYHGNYIKYFEISRCDFFNKAGFNYVDMAKFGVAFPVVKLDVKYIKSAKFDQKLVVEAELLEIEPALIFKYKIYDKITKEAICKGKTMQMGVDLKTGNSILKLPDKMKKCLEEFNV